MIATLVVKATTGKGWAGQGTGKGWARQGRAQVRDGQGRAGRR